MRTDPIRSERTLRPFLLAGAAVLALVLKPPVASALLSQEPLFTAAATSTLTLDPERAMGTAPGMASSTLGAGNLFIEGGFFWNSWEGYLRAYDQVARLEAVVEGGVAPSPLWTANFPTPDSRNILTSTALSTIVPFTWGSLTEQQRVSLDAANLGASSSPVLNYLRGEAAHELRNGGTYRNRFNTILADIVNSSPLLSHAADHAYQLQPAGSFTLPASAPQGHARYRSYVTMKKTNRPPVVVVGANGGMLHVFDARRGEATSGRELLAYVPRSLYPSLAELASEAYTHRYYVDGQVVEGDVWDGRQWRTIAAGSTGAGPAGMFAIDITSPETGFGSATIKWDIVPSEHPDSEVAQHLGNTLQAGVIGSVRDTSAPNGRGRWVYITGNGYESAGQGAALLVFDIFTGALIKAILTGAGSAAEPNGIGGITPVFDGSRNIVLVYGGDRRGNLWKFDLGSGVHADPDGAGPQKGWEVYNKLSGVSTPLFRATDAAGTGQPIVAAPRITPHPLGGLYVAFGTGKLFETTDPFDTQVQAIYLLRDQEATAPVTKVELQRLNFEEFSHDHDGDMATPGQVYRRLKAGDLADYDASDKGFYVPLIAEGGEPEGERVLAAPVLDAGVLSFTTFVPASVDERSLPAGGSYLYRLNIAGALTESGFGAVTGSAVVGKRIQRGLVSSAAPIHEAAASTGTRIDTMSAEQVKGMLLNPKYRLVDGRAVPQGASGKCALVGLRVDGTLARIPTACSGVLPLRSWRPLR